MKRNMIVLSVLAAVVAFFALNGAPIFAAAARGTAGRVVVTKSQKAEATKGQDPNIKTDRAPNPVNGPGEVAPPSKGGPRTRGYLSTVHVDNHTRWYIDIYLDGDFRGTVPPWGDLYRSVG